MALRRCAWVVLGLVTFVAWGFGAEPASPGPVPGKTDETNAQETPRAYLQLQEQLHATQLAIERNRLEADAAAAENAKAFANRLQGVEQALSLQRAQELEAMQSSNRAVLTVAGLFAVFGFLAMLFMAYFQWRTINRLAEISAALPVAHALGGGPPVAALGTGDTPLVTVISAQQSSLRLLGALERLEKRIYQLEHTPDPPRHEGPSPGQAEEVAPSVGAMSAAAPSDAAAPADAARIRVLLDKGKSLLNLDQAEKAVACFDQVLALEPNHPEALVQKGAALERLRKLDEAIACYDRAIEADGSMTVAYLYKGGLFNRMERFGEALQCYEQALRTQETRRG
jgi:tetratricopeptide (TPR) repeat protein